MPRPSLLPTPASSADIRGKIDHQVPSVDAFCTLPPPAITSANQSTSSNASEKSDSSYHPVSPVSLVGKSSGLKQKKPTGSAKEPAATCSNYALPQPPTRTRKIIHMHPGSDHNRSKPSSATVTSISNGQKSISKKQPSATSVAGRKIARKTAHSLIERRRRSKMNEEFGVLKDMIPACHGQDMHKLAILQASIDYLRYLEQCVIDLKSGDGKNQPLVNETGESTTQIGTSQTPALPCIKRSQANAVEDMEDDDDNDNEDDSESDVDNVAEDEDQDMMDCLPTALSMPTTRPLTDVDHPSPIFYASTYSKSSISSFNIHPYQSHNLHIPAPSALSVLGTACPHTASSVSSPAFSPPHHYRPSFSPILSHVETTLHSSSSIRSSTHSALTSPALLPEAIDIINAEQDLEKQEATAALLMLNRERRVSGGGIASLGQRSLRKEGRERKGGRGMSVRDLLSSWASWHKLSSQRRRTSVAIWRN